MTEKQPQQLTDMPQQSLSEYSENVTSQNGEDGILAEIFRRIGISSKTCIEFGAWDGVYLSNTWHLWHDHGWTALLIEGDEVRYTALRDSLEAYPTVTALHAFVGVQGSRRLDHILNQAQWPGPQFDLLSIDIDGDDYGVWESLEEFRPRVVVIEYNPTIPPEADMVQSLGEYFGASASALVKLGHRKGYRLSALTATNCIFVADQDFDRLSIPEVDLALEFDRTRLSYIINAYDGRTFLSSHPIFSRPFPEESFTYWKQQLIANIAEPCGAVRIPVDGIIPVSVLRLALLPRNTPMRRFATRSSSIVASALVSIGSQISKLPPIHLGLRIKSYIARRQSENQLIAAWRNDGSPLPPPHLLKQRIVLQYGNMNNLNLFVETGTYHGDMLYAMSGRFKKLYSIELSPELCADAKKRLSNYPNIEIHEGDSAQVLPRLLQSLRVPALFWLDGHYSAGNTARGLLETPISNEVQAILDHPVKGHVILIDDARNFDGSHDYPDLGSLRQSVLSRCPHATFEVKDDVIRIVL